LHVDTDEALKVLEEEKRASRSSSVPREWEDLVTQLGAACQERSKTFIAMLGTALLAKATNGKIDPFALKASIGPRGYSARSLCKDVLAAHALRLGIDLGVTGREPLNNQPFFAEERVSRDMPVKNNGREGFAILLRALGEVENLRTPEKARGALRAFLKVRTKQRSVRALGKGAGDHLSTSDLLKVIERFVGGGSEFGKRAQAVAAGLLDLLVGADRVRVGRIHDPDARFPGDVGVTFAPDSEELERTFEVRDKPVLDTDLFHVAQKALAASVLNVGVVAASSTQGEVTDAPARWAADQGALLRVFLGWKPFVDETLFWSEENGTEKVGMAFRAIHDRIVSMEVSAAGAELWSDAGQPRRRAGEDAP
jgi:hypothetical protein